MSQTEPLDQDPVFQLKGSMLAITVLELARNDLEGLDRAETVLRARPIAERRALLDRLLEAALSDGRLSPHETAAVRSVTEALGVD